MSYNFLFLLFRNNVKEAKESSMLTPVCRHFRSYKMHKHKTKALTSVLEVTK